MAGRPLSARGGLTVAHYGLIIVGVIAIAAIVLFVLQLLKNKSAEERANTAEQRLRQYGTPVSYYLDEASSRRTNAFAVINEDLRSLATVVTGKPEDVAAAVLAKSKRTIEQLAERVPDAVSAPDSLLVTLQRLASAYAELQTRAGAMSRTVAELQEQNQGLTEQLAAARAEFESQVASLGERLKQAQDEKMAAVQQKDEQLRQTQAALDAREAQVNTLRQQVSVAARATDIETGRLKTLVADLQSKIREAKQEFDPTAILTSADGRVLRAIPGSNLAYINLGAVDRIKPGMRFEVYTPERQASDGLRGKATIEVVSIMEETAECQVVRTTPGQPLLEGDIVVNIAFERGRKPKFVVRGDFDLNNDGVTDPDGLEQVRTTVRQWGGQVVEELDESVDFVVIGLPPTIAVGETAAPVTDVVRDQAAMQAMQRSAFAALVERAQKLFIPVITQNQFMFLTGNAGDRGVARR